MKIFNNSYTVYSLKRKLKRLKRIFKIKYYLLQRWFRHTCPICGKYTDSDFYGTVETKICPNCGWKHTYEER